MNTKSIHENGHIFLQLGQTLLEQDFGRQVLEPLSSGVVFQSGREAIDGLLVFQNISPTLLSIAPVHHVAILPLFVVNTEGDRYFGL
jgi:hypothetical protein